MANGSSTADIGFEQQIWAAADILRGNMDAAEYKHVVLGLIFLKYISDKFEARYQELLADGDDVEDKDASQILCKQPKAVPKKRQYQGERQYGRAHPLAIEQHRQGIHHAFEIKPFMMASAPASLAARPARTASRVHVRMTPHTTG